MKKVLAGAAAVLVVGVLGFGGAVAIQPAHTHVERTVVVAAEPGDVFPLVDDYRVFVTWSPWTDLDPSQETEFSEPSRGEGAWYSWDGNDEVGAGKMTTTEVVADAKLVQRLEFTRPFEAVATTSFTLVGEGGSTEIIWAYDADNDFFAKLGELFVDMDAMLGADFQRGLDALTPVAEEAAMARMLAEEEEIARAAEEEELARAAEEAAAEAEAQAQAEVP